MLLDAVILGAGPAGLAVAHALARRGAATRVIEPAGRVGGSIRTIREDGWLVETGPNTLQLEGPEDAALLAAYGLAEQAQAADMRAARRFIFARGQLHVLGANPLSLFASGLLSWRGRLRLLAEPFVRRGGAPGETVAAFAARRFGAEAAASLMDPVVSGVHAGDPSRLVMSACFPRVHALETSHGSVLRGLMSGPRAARQVVGFPQGMQQLAEAMAAPLRAASLRLGCVTTSLRRDRQGWQVGWRGDDGGEEGATARHLVVTAPSWQWASLPFDETVAPFLREWEHAAAPPVTVVARGYARADVPHPLDGFGYLTPGSEQRDVLGCLFPSSVLPGRAPEGHVLVCCFIGGDRRPELARLPDEALRRLVDDELATTLGVKAPPRREWIQRWARAIPQYDAGQTRREAALARAEEAHPGLRF
ncbi:MAG: protoporphyrinogen oxidase, partial [Verrucomicrobiota bacterium]